MRQFLRAILTLFIVSGLSGQDRIDEHYFTTEFTIYGNLYENKCFGIGISGGYEVICPRFQYLALEAKIGYVFLSYPDQNYKYPEHLSNRTSDKLRYKFDNDCINLAVAPKIYIPAGDGLVQNIFISNEFNFLKRFGRIRFPSEERRKIIKTTSDFDFLYSLKLGLKFGPDFISPATRCSLWVGYTFFDITDNVRTVVPDGYWAEDVRLDWNMGFGFNF